MNLDKLLADALHHAHTLKHSGARLHQSIECSLVHKAIQSYYGPPNWKSQRLIELIWTNKTPEETCSLGLFREMVHTRSGGRRLVRLDTPAGSEEVNIEFVYGEHWVHPRTPVARETSVHEILELRERFEELMREVEEEMSPCHRK